jgi:uncharacterized protein (DUF1778 family)
LSIHQHYILSMKTSTVQIRLHPSEKEAFEKAADLAGIPMSAWIRERLRRAARRELQDVNEAVPFLRDVELG